MITQDDLRHLSADKDGLGTYEYIANHIDDLSGDDACALAENIIKVDQSGQFCASAARFLNAISSDTFRKSIDMLVEATIEKDREHRYLSDLMTGIYGSDCVARASSLADDRNFRRIYNRLYPKAGSL